MPDPAGLTEETRQALRTWAERSGCNLLVLFGSSASPTRTQPRDLDLAISFPELPGPEQRLRTIGELQDACSPRTVDVVFLHPGTDPVLRFEIFRSGKAIHEARPGLFVDEVVRALALHEDSLPFRRALSHSFAGVAPGLQGAP
jgi:predicted nucleotidyltransferase